MITRWTITRLRICYADNRDHTRGGGDLRRWKRESQERSGASGKLLPDFSDLDDDADDDADDHADDHADDDVDDDAFDDAVDDDDTSECWQTL